MTQSSLPLIENADQITVDSAPSIETPKSVFDDLPAKLRDSLTAQGITAPTAIQASALPVAIQGRDILAQSHTGSGKTLAFGIPVALRLVERKAGQPRAIVLAPTRELASQVERVFHTTFSTLGFKTLCITGGESYQRQKGALSRSVDIVIGTPGRIVDLIEQGALDLSQVEIFVLDEVDQMLDIGFSEALEQVKSALPASIQTLFFSATLPPQARRLAMALLKDPVKILLETNKENRAPIDHYYIEAAPGRNLESLVNGLLYHNPDQAIIFCQTKLACAEVCDALVRRGFLAGMLNSDMKQAERTATLDRFRNSRLRYLVATDVAARGIDIQSLPLIVNFESPTSPEAYTHRAGRTGRAGIAGAAWTIVTPREGRYFEQIMRVTKIAAKKLPIPTRTEVLGKRLQLLLDTVQEAEQAPGGLTPGGLKKIVAKRLDEIPAEEAKEVLASFLVNKLSNLQVFDAGEIASNRPIIRHGDLPEKRFERKGGGGSFPPRGGAPFGRKGGSAEKFTRVPPFGDKDRKKSFKGPFPAPAKPAFGKPIKKK